MKLLIAILALSAFTLGVSSSKALTGTVELDLNTLTLEKYDALAPVSCGSDSMGLNIKCGDMLYLEYIGENEPLEIGKIYTYHSANHSVVHRLVECVDNCSILILKGDNNAVAEKINRSQIYAKVKGVRYS